MQGWIAESAGDLVAFILTRVIADEMEILNLAVEPSGRRHGIASLLLGEALTQGREQAAKRAYLEVRKSNSAARAFYISHGFTETAQRKAYYSQPVEDAIILVREIR